jgi:hypothetical protein
VVQTGFPLPPNVPQALVALQPLVQAGWGGQLPDVAEGETFWASIRDAPSLLAAGQARLWTEADGPLPPPEPRFTAHGSAGFAAGTSNSSY